MNRVTRRLNFWSHDSRKLSHLRVVGGMRRRATYVYQKLSSVRRDVVGRFSILKKFKSYLIRKFAEENQPRDGWLSVASEEDKGGETRRDASEKEADTAELQSQSDKCIPIDPRRLVQSDIP